MAATDKCFFYFFIIISTIGILKKSVFYWGEKVNYLHLTFPPVKYRLKKNNNPIYVFGKTCLAY